MIRVLHVVGRLGSGGDSKIICDIKRKIEKDDIIFDFLTFEIKENEITEEIRKSDSKIFVIEEGDLRKCGLKKYLKNLDEFFKKHNDYDYVHIHVGMQSGVVSYICKKNNISRIIVHAHTTTLQRKTNLIKKLFVTPVFRRLINTYANQKVACGEEAGIFLFGNRANFTVIHNGIEILKYNKEIGNDIKEELGINQEEFILTQVGSFQYMKNQEFSIKMIQNLEKDYKLLLVGAGKDDEYIKRQIEKNMNIYQLGRRNDVIDILKCTDFFVMPSRKGEGLPISLIEAQIAGCVCIVSDNITKEADMGLGLVKYLSLNDMTKWVDVIKNKKDKVNYTLEERLERARQLEFDIEATIYKWKTLYKGEKDESKFDK